MYNPSIYLQIVEETSESWETSKASQQGEHHEGAHETTRTSVGIRLVSILAASWICNNDWLLCLLHFVLTDWRSSSTVLWYYYYNVIKIKILTHYTFLIISTHIYMYVHFHYIYNVYSTCCNHFGKGCLVVQWTFIWENARVCTANTGCWMYLESSCLEMLSVQCH